ncbi:MAG: ABC transporter permease subunit [Rhizobacter sp.]|nr:ABC transporter permease subunit [Chlorobiales bacterium]
MKRTNASGAVTFFLLTAAIGLPLMALLIGSVGKRWYFPQLLPATFDTEAWQQVASGKVWEATLTSFGIAGVVTAVAVAIGFPAGRVLASRQIAGVNVIRLLLLFPALAPPVMLGTGTQVFFTLTRLSGTTVGVVLAHLIPAVPYAALVSTGIFAGFNFRLEEQARTLGAAPWQVLWFVTRPALLPGVITVAFFSFLISWSQYALTMQIGGGRITTLPMLVMNYLGGGNPQFASAASLMMIVPTLLIIALVYKQPGNAQSGQW